MTKINILPAIIGSRTTASLELLADEPALCAWLKRTDPFQIRSKITLALYPKLEFLLWNKSTRHFENVLAPARELVGGGFHLELHAAKLVTRSIYLHNDGVVRVYAEPEE